LLERSADFTEEAQLNRAQIRWLVQLEKLVARRRSGRGLSSAHQSALFAQFVRFLSDMARQTPLLLVLDDLQWADVGTISLLFHISRNLAGQRILLLGAFRPEEVAVMQDGKRHPLAPVIHEMERDFGGIILELGQEADFLFVEALVDSEPNVLDATFRMKLFQQTGGHPLYTAELLRGLQERGDLVRNQEGQWAAGKDLDWDTIPPRVEGVIAERVGRLPPSLQYLLQAASVQGESFSAEIAARTVKVDEDKALSALSGVISRDHRLVHAQSIERAGEGKARLSIYQFHHFLFQKYLYNRLDTIEKARLHEATGETLASVSGDQVSEIAVQLAHHFEMAEIVEKAVHYRILAGNYAIKLLALEEAIAHFSKGLALLDLLDETPKTAQQELALQLGLGTGYQLLGGYGSTEAQRAYSRARDLCLQEGESPQLVAALWPLATYATMIGDMQQGVKLAEQALFVARRVEDPLFICVAHHHVGWILYERGRFLESVKHQEETIAMYDPRYHEAMVQMFGHDFGVTSLGWISWPLWYLGYPDTALQRGHEAIALAQSFDHPFSLMHAYNMTALVHVLRGELTKAGEFAARIERLATTYGFASYTAAANTFFGYGLIGRGQVAEGIAILRKGLAIFEAGGVRLYHRGTLGFIAEQYASVGQIELGHKALAEADALRFNDRACGRIEHARGLLLEGQGAVAQEVETCFLQAIEIAREQQAKSSELKATMSLCRLWKGQGRREKAREKLAAVYNWFTEGFDTADLQVAAALLDELT
jgi:tetratricopeptide (TPR) repeat protein